MRTERFDTGLTDELHELELAAKLLIRAPSLVAEAHARGYAEVQFVQSFEDHKVQLVYFVSRMAPTNDETPDVAALGRISSDAPLGASLETGLGLTRVFDRPSFVLTTWLPYKPDDRGDPAVWPNSPPIPAPICGDGVCVPNRGETGATCPADCTPHCGDGTCQAGETQSACPSDCALPVID